MGHPDIIPSTVRSRSVARALGRVIDTVLDPLEAFRDIDTQPTSGVALLALVALRFGSVLAFYHPDTTPAKLLAGILFQLVMLMPVLAITASLLWVVGVCWRSRLSWVSAWCVTTHVMFAYTLLTVAIASVAGALLPDSAIVDLRTPPFTNLGGLVSAHDWPSLHALAVEADLRSFYAAGLAWIGVRATAHVAGPRAALIVGTCFVIEVMAALAPTVYR